ncbi:MAG: DUF2249 domain-containing protein [SAR202 cluster bacterium]|nr:DUF2249 domain-containing protein [SAR202 cluster bacterium]MDP6301139.1 DUF2249 domain-containing protein [SAR202 cluster bacterium]MDP7103471.1 DUF2249 domain-containing protein [SAR202 cluster bacterium]MDP7226378.1 DUF2249 domain-containing protein [SAR202 cluster bacterium]MDP7415182.1 DUF2249 domain-containing protein [SAR202 cluster bacterium]
MATLDVRPDLAAGQDPFQRIMAAVNELGADEELEVIAPFEPEPLYAAMAELGFGHVTEALGEGVFKVTFGR